jgi:hypothetical protein
MQDLVGSFAKLVDKRWQYFSVASDDVLLMGAIVDIGYAANTFLCLVDLKVGETLWDESFMAIPGVKVERDPSVGILARAWAPPSRSIQLSRASVGSPFALRIESGALSVDVSLDPSDAPSPLKVNASSGRNRTVFTQKTSLLKAQGRIRVGGREWDLRGAFGGFDFPCGQLPRITEWRWAFGQGRLADGTTLAFNLAHGNNLGGTSENAVWLGSELFRLDGVARFHFDSANPRSPWRIITDDGSVELEFESKGLHREERNLVVVQSRFVQVVGLFRGRMRLPNGHQFELSGLPGVTEDQRVKW